MSDHLAREVSLNHVPRLGFGLLLLLTGCSGLNVRPGGVADAPTLVAFPNPEETAMAGAARVTARPLCSAAGQCTQYALVVENTSSAPIEVIWDKVQFVEQGETRGGVLFDGVKYIEKDLSRPPSIIIPGGRIARNLAPSNHVSFTEVGWVSSPMLFGDVALIVTVRDEGGEHIVVVGHRLAFATKAEQQAWGDARAATKRAAETPAEVAPGGPAPNAAVDPAGGSEGGGG